MYLSRAELTGVLILGALFLLWGLVAIAQGNTDMATTLLAGSLAILGIYVLHEEVQPRS